MTKRRRHQPCFGRLSLFTLLLSYSVAIEHAALAVPASDAEKSQAQRWIAAKFQAIPEKLPSRAHLTLNLRGRLLKNMATTKVYHTEVGSLPLKIADQTFPRGIYCPSTGSITVRLPSPGKTFQAIFGIDSNRVQSFYSNAGQGSVVGTVAIDGNERYRSHVMKEGLRGESVKVELDGAEEFTLTMTDAGDGVVERVDFNQADWAEARVELRNGQTVWLGDLPTAPLRTPYSSDLPFSFDYGGQPARELLGTWKQTTSKRVIDKQRTERTLLWQDPASGLQVRCVSIEYQDFPVVEWKLFFKNTGDKPTALIENVLPLDSQFERHNEGEFTLHHSNGSPHSLVKMSDPTDYAPRTTTLSPQESFDLGSKIGLPASHDLPFFNLEWNNQGIIVAIGWPGQWSASFQRNQDRGLTLQAGQELTHFKLFPGEEVRSPLIAMMFWQGSHWQRAQNLWRAWMIQHNLPRTGDGQLPPAHHAASSSAYYMESTGATISNQKMFIDRYREENIKPDYWWIDAGWYDYEDYWLNVGTWRPNQKRFPDGLHPISDHLHANDMKMILWFAPECVTRGSLIDRTHPEWLLKGGAEWWMGHALIQGEFPAHTNDSGLTLFEDVAAFGTGNPDATAQGRTQLADGEWHLVTATRFVDREADRSELNLYIDGQLERRSFSTNTRPLDANISWGVGRQHQTRGIVGDIDDVRIYDTALNAQQVAAVYARNDTLAPFAHYPFDGHTLDVVGEHHGEHIGSGEYQYIVGSTQASKDQALRFNNDYGVEIPNHVPNDFTLSCWVRMESPQAPPYGRGDFRLLNLSEPDCVAWLVDHIDEQIEKQGVDLYRHDGMPPLSYWRANDLPDRQGITEMKHVAGLLHFWDELKRRHPMLRIDICSGGGSRNELETLRRAVPLWRSDYAYETTGMQTLTYGMLPWIPYFGTAINATDSYTFLSQLAPANVTSWDVRRRDFDYDFCRRMLKIRSAVTDFYYADFYPLTSYRTENDVWMAWQFHDPESETGIVQAFRRPQSPANSLQLRLQEIQHDKRYQFSNLMDDTSFILDGKEIQTNGLPVTLNQRRTATLLHYQVVP